MKTTHILRLRPLVVGCLAAFALLGSPAAHAGVTLAGNFQTGAPTPTLTLTSSFTLTITTSGSIGILAFDEWNTNASAGGNHRAFTTGQTLSYQINAGVVMTIAVSNFADRLGFNQGAITANDSFIGFADTIPVTAGQTITFLPGTTSYGTNTNFVTPPSTFTGNAYVTDANGGGMSSLGSVGAVPEPSTWALLVAGAGLLGLVYRQRRTGRA